GGRTGAAAVAGVPDGAVRASDGGGAAGGGFAACRGGAGAVARRRRLPNIAAILPPTAETSPPIVDPTPVIADHAGRGSSGWNHQEAPAATPPSTSTSSVRFSAGGRLGLRPGL